MSYKGNVAVVLFNPPLSCIEKILEFISVFKHTHSELHVLSDMEHPEGKTKEADLLVLELKVPKKTSELLVKYVSQIYPAVNVFIITDQKEVLSGFTGLKNKLPLSNHSFDLN